MGAYKYACNTEGTGQKFLMFIGFVASFQQRGFFAMRWFCRARPHNDAATTPHTYTGVSASANAVLVFAFHPQQLSTPCHEVQFVVVD